MNKRAAVYVTAGALPVSILFFSILFASGAFRYHTESMLPELGCSDYLGVAFFDWLDEAERREILGLYLRNQFRLAGSRQVASYVLPDTSTLQTKRKKAPIRPSGTHGLWRRLHKEGLFRWPVDPARFWVSSYYGPRTLRGRRGFHGGIDLAARLGTPVVAAASGYVQQAEYDQGYGNYILLVHPRSFKTRYAHLSTIRVKKGQRVRAGQIIGRVGATGRVHKSTNSSSGSHLHFEVYKSGNRVNPLRFLA